MITNTDAQSNWVSIAPASSGPSDEIAAPSPDQSAIDRVRACPDHSAVISASVVGKASPAARPPSTRAQNRTSIDGANAASNDAGIASPVPDQISSSLRP